jgi:hypothetical protein
MLRDVINEILTRNGLATPDGRPLHAYQLTPEETEQLRTFLIQRVRINPDHRLTGIGFVLWASERVRTAYGAGHLTWEFIFNGLHPQLQLDNRQQTGVRLVSNGFPYWQRPIRLYENRHQYLYSILAEAGIPDLALAEGATAYRNALFQVISAVESGGELGAVAAYPAAQRALTALPGVFGNADMARLMADLALCLISFRSLLPDNLPPGTHIGWLDANHPNWRKTLPVRLSADTIGGIIIPALERPRLRSQEAPVTRQLRRHENGGWIGFATIHEGAVIPFALLPEANREDRIRFLSEDGTGFFGSPAEYGWVLARTGGSGDVDIAKNPSDPVILSAYCDGKSVGSVVLSPALPSAEDAGSFWKVDNDPVLLTQITGRVQTRSDQAFLLWGREPPSADAGLEIGGPAPAPDGRLWPVHGDGILTFGGMTVRVRTGTDQDAPQAQMNLLGRVLSGQLTRRDLQVHLGEPQVLASEGGGIYKVIQPVWRESRRLLGGRVAEWVRDGEILARVSLIQLPDRFEIRMREMGVGRLEVAGVGLKPGWHLHVSVGDVISSGVADHDGAVTVQIHAPPPCGAVSARISEPETGRDLTLDGVWPSLAPAILRPDGSVLCENADVSHGQLLGWRGSAPQNGSLDVRVHAQGQPVSFRVPDVSSLVSHLDVIRPVMALNGLDGRVNLSFVSNGAESPRLSVRRYGWESQEAMDFRELCGHETRLSAVNMRDPSDVRETTRSNRIDMGGWLGDDQGPWLVQGDTTGAGYMRPFLWAPHPIPPTTRKDRITEYEARWRALLEDPAGEGWSEMWGPISSVRSVGDGASLDQVQALGRVPAAAVSALFRSGHKRVSEVIGLEGEAPIWWPSVKITDWTEGLRAARAAIAHQVSQIIPNENEADRLVRGEIEHVAEVIVLLRPELKAHVGFAMIGNNMAPVIPIAGQMTPLFGPNNPLDALFHQAQLAVQRHDGLPGGVGDVAAPPSPLTGRLQIFFNGVQPLLHAPLVVAEAATGLRAPLTAHQLLQLTALRISDPVWFDAALPIALSHLYGSQR